MLPRSKLPVCQQSTTIRQTLERPSPTGQRGILALAIMRRLAPAANHSGHLICTREGVVDMDSMDSMAICHDKVLITGAWGCTWQLTQPYAREHRAVCSNCVRLQRTMWRSRQHSVQCVSGAIALIRCNNLCVVVAVLKMPPMF